MDNSKKRKFSGVDDMPNKKVNHSSDVLHIKLNDNRIFLLPCHVLQKFPSSPIYTYWLEYPNGEYVLDIDYDIFVVMSHVMTGMLEYRFVNGKIQSLLDRYGLVDEKIISIRLSLVSHMELKYTKIYDFMTKPNQCLITSHQKYTTYKKLFALDKNIIPIQLVIIMDGVSPLSIGCLNMYEGIPIYREHPNVDDDKQLMITHVMDFPTNEINIHLARYHMFFKYYDTETKQVTRPEIEIANNNLLETFATEPSSDQNSVDELSDDDYIDYEEIFDDTNTLLKDLCSPIITNYISEVIVTTQLQFTNENTILFSLTTEKGDNLPSIGNIQTDIPLKSLIGNIIEIVKQHREYLDSKCSKYGCVKGSDGHFEMHALYGFVHMSP